MNGSSALLRFRAEYSAHRAAEGRAHSGEELRALPYLRTGAFAKQGSVRARTFDAFMARVVAPVVRATSRPIRVLDLGAGNGWLCRRIALTGGEAVALDLRDDAVDGLGAATELLAESGFERVAASFDALPLSDEHFDVVVFNASLHYALDLRAVLREARRVVRRGGRVAVLDSPFYSRESDGVAMVDFKRRYAGDQFGDRADALLALPFIEFLTEERLVEASVGLGFVWRRHRIWYPMWYEMRPILARLSGQRVPSRFDLWECEAA